MVADYTTVSGLSTYADGDPVPPTWGQQVDINLTAIHLGPEYWVLVGGPLTVPPGATVIAVAPVPGRNNPNGAAAVWTSGNPDEIVIAAPGLYTVSLVTRWSGIVGAYAAPQQVASYVGVLNTGASICYDARFAYPGSAPVVTCSEIAEFSGGDTLAVAIINSTGTTQTVTSMSVAGRKIGGAVI